MSISKQGWRQYILAVVVPAKSWLNFKKVPGSIPHRSTHGHTNGSKFILSEDWRRFEDSFLNLNSLFSSRLSCKLKNCISNFLLSTPETYRNYNHEHYCVADRKSIFGGRQHPKSTGPLIALFLHFGGKFFYRSQGTANGGYTI